MTTRRAALGARLIQAARSAAEADAPRAGDLSMTFIRSPASLDWVCRPILQGLDGANDVVEAARPTVLRDEVAARIDLLVPEPGRRREQVSRQAVDRGVAPLAGQRGPGGIGRQRRGRMPGLDAFG